MSPHAPLAVIGLDCVPPALVFERWRHELPNLGGLIDRGAFGPMRSCTPPITVPAWMSMMTGYDAGELGLYGFRNRTDSTTALSFPNGDHIFAKTLWDLAGAAEKRVCVFGVPLTWPARPVNGTMVTGFLTPDLHGPWTHPHTLGGELASVFGPYLMDVLDYRAQDPAGVLRDACALHSQHVAMVQYLWRKERPDLLVFVEIAPDRVHHALWDRRDDLMLDYYRDLDRHLGQLLKTLGDGVNILVVSDHGARSLRGVFHINQWLMDEGWLVLRDAPDPSKPLAHDRIDWSRTRAWAEGGYYARLWVSTAGRDVHGWLGPSEALAVKRQLAESLARVPGPGGRSVRHRVVDPREHFRVTKGIPPDLMFFPGDLDYRASARVGPLWSEQNDTGPDGCNHDWDGIAVMAGPDVPRHGPMARCSLFDVLPTALHLMQLPIPPRLRGFTVLPGERARTLTAPQL